MSRMPSKDDAMHASVPTEQAGCLSYQASEFVSIVLVGFALATSAAFRAFRAVGAAVAPSKRGYRIHLLDAAAFASLVLNGKSLGSQLITT